MCGLHKLKEFLKNDIYCRENLKYRFQSKNETKFCFQHFSV